MKFALSLQSFSKKNLLLLKKTRKIFFGPIHAQPLRPEPSSPLQFILQTLEHKKKYQYTVKQNKNGTISLRGNKPYMFLIFLGFNLSIVFAFILGFNIRIFTCFIFSIIIVILSLKNRLAELGPHCSSIISKNQLASRLTSESAGSSFASW